MIRTTYRGRAIKILAARGKPYHRKMVINGYTLNYAWQGDDSQALDWFRRQIDKMDASGGPGNSAQILPGYTSTFWWEPGTFDVNEARHATQPGGVCLCTQCVIADVGGGKARYAPLHPDACQHCHQLEDGHDDDVDFLNTHYYTEPTHAQRTGRQAAIDRYNQSGMDEPPSCDAKYHKDVPGYLGRPTCLLFADHSDANEGYENRHQDARGFMWPREAEAR